MADQAIIDKLTSQILGQGLTSQWKGEGHGSAEANARDMAKIMADTGITDIKQFGQIPAYSQVDEIGKLYNGQQARSYENEDGSIDYYVAKPTGQTDENGSDIYTNVLVPKNAKLTPIYGQVGSDGEYVAVDPSKITIRNGVPVIEAGTTYGNKATGAAVPNTYSERQTGNAWGGTFAGSGNTGYRVQFTPDGTPIFYTTSASSNDRANLLADLGPIGQIAIAVATGGLSIPEQIAAQMAVQFLSGVEPNDIIKNAVVSFAGAQIPGMEFMKEGASFIQDLGLSETLTKTLTTSFQNAAVSAGTALLKGESIVDAALRGGATGGINGAVNAILGNIDGFSDLSKTQKKLITNAVTGAFSGKTFNQIAINSAIGAANAEIAEQRKLNAPLDEKAISELTPEEKAVYDEYGTKGLKYSADITKLLAGIDSGSSENTDSGLSNQDILDMIYGGTDAGGNITDTTCLDTGETIPGGTDGTDTVSITGDKGVTGVDTFVNNLTTKGTDLGTVNVTACGPGKVRNAKGDCVDIDCGEGKYWDPVTKQCELKKVETVDVKDTGTDKGTVTVTACGPGKVRNAKGDCVDIDCGDGKYWDPTTGKCELKKVETLVCGANQELSPDGKSCLTKCGPGYTRGPDGISCVKDDEIVIKACPSGQVRNAAGICVPIDCGDGKYWDPITKQCELKKVETLVCGANEEKSPDGKSCIPKCGTGFKRGADGISCVPITTTVPPVVVPPVVVTPKTTTDTTLATAATPATSTETTAPIYAGAMDDFNLFSTLSDLLADNENKKTTQQSQQTTKMATGGHLDDLLAEQITVDDLLKLLR